MAAAAKDEDLLVTARRPGATDWRRPARGCRDRRDRRSRLSQPLVA
jgi:hypothetical protein